jgi:hypothetical protein
MFSRTHTEGPATPTLLLWTGRVFSGLFTLFMLFDTGIKLLNLRIVEESMTALGYPPGMGQPIGALEAIILALYLFRRTSVLGAVLFTGIFGGAIASHLRLGDPLFSHVLFGVYLGLFAWGGLWLRDPQLRALFPLRRD